MSAKRRRAPFGLQHLTVVPRNADVESESDDEDEERVETA